MSIVRVGGFGVNATVAGGLLRVVVLERPLGGGGVKVHRDHVVAIDDAWSGSGRNWDLKVLHVCYVETFLNTTFERGLLKNSLLTPKKSLL